MILLLKVTLLLGAGWLAAALFSRRPAAVRHLIWVLTLSGALALPLATPIAPVLRVPLLALPAVSVGRSGSVPRDNPGTVRIGERGTLAAAAPGRDRAVPPISQPPTRTPPGVDPGQALLAVWLLGALIVALWYGLGHARLARLLRRAAPVDQPEWRLLLQEVALQSGVRAPVRLFRSPAVGSPVTWGTRRPVVLLPADAESWSTERRRIVLAHELAHAARGDYTAQLIACLASALYWFHPLAWVAVRRLRVESERASDDHVVTRGVSGFEYAAHLLDVARQSRVLRLGGMVSIGMARPTHFEGRLLAVLDQRRPRQAPRARARRAAWAGLMGLVVPLAALTPVPRAGDAAGSDLHPPGLPVTALAAVSAPLSPADKTPIRQQSDSVIERSIAATPGGVLELDLESGGTVELRGWDEPTVRVLGRLAGPNWRDTRVSVERSGDGVTVHSWQENRRKSSSTSHRFEIRVPRRYDVRINSAGGDVTIVDVEGSFDGETGGGEIVIERAHGRAHLSTGGGEIRVADSDLGGTVSTGGGLVTLSQVRGGLKGRSGSGPVIYAGGEGLTGDLKALTIDREGIHVGKGETRADDMGMLHIQKAGGAIILEGAPAGAELVTGGGQIRVGPSKGFIGASTGGGDIDIGPVAGSVKAGTGAGSVRIWITEAKGEERLIDVTSGSGPVLLELPPDLGARFELETAYTRSFGRRTSIASDWALENEETSDWDDTQGSPRKYVRAYGRVGGGDGLIRVRTVNGNITVRRRQP
jgi:beta-lactamase regulating signal transducer with metallopeptidase domain